MEVGKAMYARDKTSRAVPCWLIFDDRYRKRYADQPSSPGRFPRKLARERDLKQAWTLSYHCATCAGLIPSGLSETVERFNEHAARGVDPDYGRGEYLGDNRALGYSDQEAHPCLDPIDEPPHYVVQVVPEPSDLRRPAHRCRRTGHQGR